MLLLTCLFFANASAPTLAQPPSVPSAASSPAKAAKPASPALAPTPAVPVAESSAVASASPTPLATPATRVNPADLAAPALPAALATPAAGSGQLNLPTQSDQQSMAQWKQKGAVGQSTFFDRLRSVTVILAIICFIVWLLGKLVSRGTLEKLGLPGDSSSLIEVLEKKRLSPGRSIMLLKVGPKVLAVAVTESGFRTLAEIDAEALKQCQDELAPGVTGAVGPVAPPSNAPGDIAKHYLSIIPGLGAKK